jgi:hypothetical protein
MREGLVGLKLRECNFAHVSPRLSFLCPFDDELERFLQTQRGVPTEAGSYFGNIKLQIVGLVRVFT